MKPNGTAEERFDEFNRANPDVYAELVKLAREARRRGLVKVGIKMLWEVMRWNRMVRVNLSADEEYKLNNNYHSRYARLMMHKEPDLSGLFELRELKS